MGTSTAGYSPDEDAFNPHTQAVASNGPATTTAGSATGTALFDQRNGSQLYGASPFPAEPSKSDSPYITSAALKGKLAVLRIHSSRNDSNLLAVSAGLKNQSSHPLPLQIETVYKDKNAQPISDSDDKWVNLTLQPHEETQYQSVATSEDATDFVVRIRKVAAPKTAQP